MKKQMVVAGVTFACGALMALLGLGGILTDVMIYGGPHAPPPEPFTGHVLLWLVCILMGSAFAVLGIVRGVAALRRRTGPRG